MTSEGEDFDRGVLLLRSKGLAGSIAEFAASIKAGSISFGIDLIPMRHISRNAKL